MEGLVLPCGHYRGQYQSLGAASEELTYPISG
jgi:hypothetical protein